MKQRKNNGIFYVVISLVAVLGIGAGVIAYTVSNNVNVEGDYIYNEAEGQLVDEVNLGGVLGSDVYTDVVFHGVTQLGREEANITIPIQLRATTSDTTLRNVAGLFKNTGDKMLCSNPRIWFYDDINGFGSSFGVGTTTNKDGSYLTATTSRSILSSQRIGTSTEDWGYDTYGMIASSTDYIGTAEALAGGTWYDGAVNASSSTFLLDTDVIVVVDAGYEGATSTESWANGEAATNNTIGYFYLDCITISD